MTEVAHENHYVPQAMLRRWSLDGEWVYAYRTLVSNSDVPQWEPQRIRGLAKQRDLYTTIAEGREDDEFEHWIEQEYETPGFEAMQKLIARARMTPGDWHAVGRFVALQDLRTPLSLIESMNRWKDEFPKILDKTLRDLVAELEQAKVKGEKLEVPRGVGTFATPAIRVKIERPTDPGSDQALVRAEVSAGRRLWIDMTRRILIRRAEALARHRWSVVAPCDGEEWPLTDHPVLRLNYYGPGRYDFLGGWAKPGSEILMPLSPRHLLYVRVEFRGDYRPTFSADLTQLTQRLLVERAFRWVFMRSPAEWVPRVRPRDVDAEQVDTERKAWAEWHADQSRGEEAM